MKIFRGRSVSGVSSSLKVTALADNSRTIRPAPLAVPTFSQDGFENRPNYQWKYPNRPHETYVQNGPILQCDNRVKNSGKRFYKFS